MEIPNRNSLCAEGAVQSAQYERGGFIQRALVTNLVCVLKDAAGIRRLFARNRGEERR